MNYKKMNNEQVQYVPTTSGIVSRPAAFVHDIYIDEVLVEPSRWRAEFDTIRNAGPSDVINLRINCPGGSDMVMGAFVKAISESQGHVVGHIEHTCNSAATIIFLACNDFIVSDDAEFMVHTSSLGYGGKQNNFNEYSIFVNKTNECLIRKYYADFLTEEEIVAVLKGTDLWMDADEVITRLQRKFGQPQQPLDKEKALAMSHEDLVSYLFPEEYGDTGSETKKHTDIVEGYVDTNIIKKWDVNETIFLYKVEDSFYFEADGVEFGTQEPFTKKDMMEYAEFNTLDLVSICARMGIELKNTNYLQLVNKISKEVQRVIKDYEQSNM